MTTNNDDINSDIVDGIKKGIPKFEHDCNKCVFHAHMTYKNRPVDVYTRGKPSGARTIIVRYSSDGPDYSSGELFQCVELTNLDRFALSHGLELNQIEKDRLLVCLLRMDKQRWKRPDFDALAPHIGEHLLGPIDWYGLDY
jgi:hypothetical protein